MRVLVINLFSPRARVRVEKRALQCVRAKRAERSKWSLVSLESKRMHGSLKPRNIGTKVLSHSLFCLLARSHRPITPLNCSLALHCPLHSFACIARSHRSLVRLLCTACFTRLHASLDHTAHSFACSALLATLVCTHRLIIPLTRSLAPLKNQAF